MDESKDGRSWRIGTAADVDWIAGCASPGLSVTAAVPPVFDAYATTYQADGITAATYERAVVADLVRHTPDQPWWLGYLDTGAHDVVFPHAPRVSLYQDWHYVLVEAGPEQALTWGPATCAAPDRCPTCSSRPTGRGWSRPSGTTPGPVSAARNP